MEIAPPLRWPLDLAREVALEMSALLAPTCVRLVIAGSVRRGKATVGDVELMVVPKWENRRDSRSLFGDVERVNLLDELLGNSDRILAPRKNKLGRETIGNQIKLYRHSKTQIPVDVFVTQSASWWNYLVCRTGPSESNIRICQAARQRGWKWEPYSPGFVREDYSERSAEMDSEEAVFRFVGLEYLPPDKR